MGYSEAKKWLKEFYDKKRIITIAVPIACAIFAFFFIKIFFIPRNIVRLISWGKKKFDVETFEFIITNLNDHLNVRKKISDDLKITFDQLRLKITIHEYVDAVILLSKLTEKLLINSLPVVKKQNDFCKNINIAYQKKIITKNEKKQLHSFRKYRNEMVHNLDYEISKTQFRDFTGTIFGIAVRLASELPEIS